VIALLVNLTLRWCSSPLPRAWLPVVLTAVGSIVGAISALGAGRLPETWLRAVVAVVITVAVRLLLG
jgi:uncharacterized membrane protein YfcA